MTEASSDDEISKPSAHLTVAEHIKRLTTIIAALTALIAAITALVVATKAGWGEVGPFFSNLISHGRVEIPQKQSSDAARSADSVPALLADLESNDVHVRRRARQSLADFVSRASPGSIDALIQQLGASSSYRTKVGIAVALGTAPGGWHATDLTAAQARLRVMTSRAEDPTLRAALARASQGGRP